MPPVPWLEEPTWRRISRTGQGKSAEPAAPGLEPAGEARVMLAIVEDNLETDVAEGENAGKILRHAGVVRALLDAGQTSEGEATWSGGVSAAFEADWDRRNLRAVAFVQEVDSRSVVAIGVAKIEP